jgi:septal ring factor EnvC (AmiA/AmiB activator)
MTCYAGHRQLMKRLLFLAIVLTFSVTVAQTPADQDQLLALIKEVQAQQKKIADNQAKIDTKLADVTEAIRQARIYSKRGR